MAAAGLLSDLREQKCLSPEQLARAIFVNGHGHGVVPTLRVRGAIASYFDRAPRDIWRTAPVFHDRRNGVPA